MGKLNLMIKGGMLYANKKIFCNCGGGSGGKNIPVGRYGVEERYAHAHGDVLAFARGLGWIGHLPGCDVVIGRDDGRGGVVPSEAVAGRLLSMMEVAEDNGDLVILEVVT